MEAHKNIFNAEGPLEQGDILGYSHFKETSTAITKFCHSALWNRLKHFFAEFTMAGNR